MSPTSPAHALACTARLYRSLTSNSFVPVLREDDSKWPKKDIVGKQELEIRVGNDHISFEVSRTRPHYLRPSVYRADHISALSDGPNRRPRLGLWWTFRTLRTRKACACSTTSSRISRSVATSACLVHHLHSADLSLSLDLFSVSSSPSSPSTSKSSPVRRPLAYALPLPRLTHRSSVSFHSPAVTGRIPSDTHLSLHHPFFSHVQPNTRGPAITMTLALSLSHLSDSYGRPSITSSSFPRSPNTINIIHHPPPLPHPFANQIPLPLPRLIDHPPRLSPRRRIPTLRIQLRRAPPGEGVEERV